MKKLLCTSLEAPFSRYLKFMNRPLQTSDPEIYNIIKAEKKRQFEGINLIASENYCSNAILSVVGGILNNKYAEGYPGARYYGGTQEVDKVQLLCHKRTLELFGLSDKEWGVNCQVYSGSPANFAVYTALLNPYDRIMSLDLPHGGHLSHGFQTPTKKISAVSKYFEVLPYRVDEKTHQIDYQELHKMAMIYRPKLIVAGASAYSRLIDYKKFREICNETGSILLADIAHTAGLIAGGVIPGPFEYADVVTTTTHKTLRGTRGSLIMMKVGTYKDSKGKEVKSNLKTLIDGAVFPGIQGGPHMHTIAGIDVTLREAMDPSFKQYQKQVLKNAKAGAQALLKKNFSLVSGGTDNHLFSVDMRSKNLDGGRMEALMNHLSISINKNTVPGDKSALIPSGIRVGAPAMTTRGCKQKDFEQVAEFINKTTDICTKINKKAAGTKLKDFKDALEKELGSAEIENLNKEVHAFCTSFPVPGGLL